MLDKIFDPAAVEPRLYARWEASGAFAPRGEGEPYCIVIPPPNVTGSLHIGHALNNTLQDVLARFERMRGKAVLWLPGTDHAGIATQMVVERQLAASGANITRREMGREAFVESVWEWKAESGGTIVRQLRRLGASCDWSRERFTLDEGLSAAVRKVFVTLHKQGLIYRDKRLVNWDPHFQTAISDLEVEQREVDGHYWHLAYPLADGSGEIVVATTRPETMLGDTAVAVHPDDERYLHLHWKKVAHPITGRSIPIVPDQYADPEKGSGAVKITPAHDFNDFQVGKRHGLQVINIFDKYANVRRLSTIKPEELSELERRPSDDPHFGTRTGVFATDDADEEAIATIPENIRGKPRLMARDLVVVEMERLGLLRGIEKTRHVVPHGDRSSVVIEPWLTNQWYVDAATLAKPAIAAVEEGRTVFEPRNWEKTYFEWMRNIEPWCVSRQLWWGHRIPAWYAVDGEIFVEESEDEARAAARAHFGHDAELRQDEDVLDTWFSSALWPFSTLGWPENTEDLRRFYPTTDLVTGFDIIFFWVARMMMMGIHFLDGEAPFRRVVINGLVRDEKGQKMSKSKGNVIDPLEIVDELGADPLRFTMAMLSGTREIKLSRQRIEGYRNFGTKLWNAARFCQINGCVRVEGFDPGAADHTLNRWIRGETVKTAAEVTRALEAAHFAEAAQALYRFVWNVFCDWHLELAKPVLNGADEPAKAETRAMTAWVLDQCLKLLHPVTPFITEELWQRLGEQGPAREGMLITAEWPGLPQAWIDAKAAAEIGLIIAAVSEGRSVRSELNVPPSARPVLHLTEASPRQRAVFEANSAVIRSMLRVQSIAFAVAPPGAVPFVVEGAALALPVAEFIDLAAERARLAKDLAGLDGEIARAAGKLGNPAYLAKAPETVVEQTRAKLAEAEAAKAKLQSALRRLEAAA